LSDLTMDCQTLKFACDKVNIPASGDMNYARGAERMIRLVREGIPKLLENPESLVILLGAIGRVSTTCIRVSVPLLHPGS
jgi:hypothetical protein